MTHNPEDVKTVATALLGGIVMWNASIVDCPVLIARDLLT